MVSEHEPLLDAVYITNFVDWYIFRSKLNDIWQNIDLTRIELVLFLLI